MNVVAAKNDKIDNKEECGDVIGRMTATSLAYGRKCKSSR